MMFAKPLLKGSCRGWGPGFDLATAGAAGTPRPKAPPPPGVLISAGPPPGLADAADNPLEPAAAKPLIVPRGRAAGFPDCSPWEPPAAAAQRRFQRPTRSHSNLRIPGSGIITSEMISPATRTSIWSNIFQHALDVFPA